MPKRKIDDIFPRKVSQLHWFRKGLRLHDNPALKEGLERGTEVFRCVYILDPWFAGLCEKGINRWRFLLDCLEDLDKSLRKLNSRLFLVRGQPADVFPRLLKEWSITHLSFEEDCEPYGREKDQVIKALAQEAGVEVICRRSHTLYDPQEVLRLNNNEPPLTYSRFQEIVSIIGPPEHPVAPVTAQDVEGVDMAIASDHYEKYGIPSLEELGFDTENIPVKVWVGGETEALQRLNRHLERKAWVANFERPRMSPIALNPSPTSLSPYLRFGCLSSRMFYWELTDLFIKVRRTNKIPLSLHGQLLWREFFFSVGCNNPNLDQMENNPICIQIPWDRNPDYLKRWAEGKTGFPWIDAIMTQLRLEGWIHPLARHAIACFLTRGDLWISWEEGVKVFEELLLDADWSVNAGNWIWLSCSSFYQQFFHCYCPVKFGRRTDPEGEFIRKYLPVLKNMPTKYIFDPWTAPVEVQEEAKCIIGKHYPAPIVNHAEASHTNIEKMKKVFKNISKYCGPGLLATVPSSKADSTRLSSAKSFIVPYQTQREAPRETTDSLCMQQQSVMQQVQKVYSSPVDMMKMPGMSHSQGGDQQRQVNFMGNQIGLAGNRVTQMSSNLQGMGHSFFS